MIYLTFIRLVNDGKPSYILVFSTKKKKLQIIQKDVVYYNYYKFAYIGFTSKCINF